MTMHRCIKLIAVVVSMALVMTGCGKKKENTVTVEPTALTFAAQEEGTAAYEYASALRTAMLDILPKGSNITLTTDSPGGVGAPTVISSGGTDLILSNSVPAKMSYEEGLFGAEKTDNIRALAGGLGHDFVNVMFTKKFTDETGISTLEELVEQKYPVRLIVKKDGTLGEMTAEAVFSALGVSFEDIESWGGQVEKTSGDLIVEGLQDDLYDMTIDHVGAGQNNTRTLCLTHEMVFVQMGDKVLSALTDMGYDYIDIDANTWNGQTETIKTVGSQQCVLVRDDMDSDLAYLLTKSMCEEKELLAITVSAMEYFEPETAGSAAVTGVPLHPGAERYFREMGYIE